MSFGASSTKLLWLEPQREPKYLHHYLAANGSCFASRCSGRTVSFTRAGREQWGRELKYGLQIGNGRGWRGIQLSRRTPSVLPIYAMPMTLLSSSLQEREKEREGNNNIYMYLAACFSLGNSCRSQWQERLQCWRSVMQQPAWSRGLPALAQVALSRIIHWVVRWLGRKGCGKGNFLTALQALREVKPRLKAGLDLTPKLTPSLISHSGETELKGRFLHDLDASQPQFPCL